MTNQDQLQYLMESVACDHTFMDAMQTHSATQLVTSGLTVEDVNRVAKNICRHIAYFGVDGEPMPSSIVACAPTGERRLALFFSRPAAPFFMILSPKNGWSCLSDCHSQ